MSRPKSASIGRVALSQALIVLTAWLSLAPLLHGAGDDPDCNPAIILHDSSQHSVANAGTQGDEPAARDHCLACHLFRYSRSAIAWKFVPQRLDNGSLVVAVAGGLIITRAAVPIPARAPPVQI